MKIQLENCSSNGFASTAPVFTSALGKRSASIALAAALISATALAGDPPGATYPLIHSISPVAGTLSDVAIFAPRDRATSVFVADRSTGRRVMRYAGTGSSSVVTHSAGLGFNNNYSPIGLAANDNPGSTNFGDIYACDFTPTGGRLFILNNANLAVLGLSNLTTQVAAIPVSAPVDVAVDAAGNVFVADAGTHKVFKYSAADVAARPAVLTAVMEFASGTGAPSGVSVDHNDRVHATIDVSAWASEYVVFNPNAALAATDSLLPSVAWGVCALNPCADGFLPRGPVGAQYDFARHNWNWVSMTGIADLVAGAGGVIARPEGIEYQKFNYSLSTGVPWGWLPQRCDERMYVCSMNKVRVFGQSYFSVPLPLGKVAWWRFDDIQDTAPPEVAVTIDDYLGPNDATAGPVVPRTVEGMVGNGFDTRAGAAFATAPDSATLNFGTGSLTIEGWLRSEQRTGTITVLDKRVGTGAGYSVYLSNGRLGFQTNVGSTFQNFTATGAPVIADGSWRHFAVVLDRTPTNQVRLYVNGLPVGATAALAGSVTNTGPLVLGRTNSGAGPLRGAIDELTLYSQPLSDLQILGIANARSAGKHLWRSLPTEL